MGNNSKTHGLKTMLMILALVVLLPLSAMAQNAMEKKVTINVKSATVESVFATIQKQTGLNFFYSADLAKTWPKVKVKVTDKSAENAISQVTSAIGCIYEVKGNIVTIKKQKLSGKQRKVEGYVSDDTGQPVAGAPVCIGETKVCTVTDADGHFEFNIPTEETTLKVSYLGMETEYVTIAAGASNVKRNVTLKNNNVLDNVMVTGYQTISSGRATGSYSVLKPEELHTVVSNNFVDNLEGKVAGLAVDGQGNMIIRGQATIYAETKPLIVVDGFPMEYDSYTINPNDIEQISVLKDAASASIWGVRAANGVIVITTKKGKNNQKTNINYSGSLKIGNSFNVESLGYLNSAQQIDFEREFWGTQDVVATAMAGATQNYSEAAAIEMQYRKGQLDEAGRTAAFNKLGSYTNFSDIQKEFYRNPFLQTHNISISGGSHITNNYLSVNFENSLASLRGNDENRINLQFNNTTALSKKIALTSGVRGMYSNKDSYTGTPTTMRPYVHLDDTELYGVSQMVKENLVASGVGYQNWNYNRLQDRDEVDDNTKAYDVSAHMQLDFTLPFGFKFATSGMFTIDHSSQEILNSRSSYFVRDLYNQFTDATGTSYLPEGAIKDMYEINSTSYTWRNVLNYNYEKKDWSVNAMAGCEMFAIRTKTQYDRYYGYDPQGMVYDYTMNLNDLVSTGVYGYDPTQGQMKLQYNPYHKDVEDRYFSTFATASGTYKDRYTLFGSIRYDKTNLYGRSGKYRDQPTWSVGGKWDISKESFFHADWVNLLSVKASYGLSGNIDKTTSPYLIASNARDLYSGLQCLIISNPENLELGWEKVYTTNLGLNASMFNNRLNLSLDYYNRHTKDALGMSTLDPTTGWTSIKKNVSELVNRGVDLNISGTPVKTRDFEWRTGLTFSYNYNKVLDVNSTASTFLSLTDGDPIEEQPVDYVWEIRTTKLSETGDLQIVDAEGNVSDYTGVNNFDMDDYVFSGRLSPKYYGAWTNSLSWKHFTLDWTMTYKLGHKMYMPQLSYIYLDAKMYKTFDERWRKAGDENTTWVPRGEFGGVSGTYQSVYNHIDHQVESANVIRMKSIGLAYDFSYLLHKTIISGLNLRFAVENAFYWAKNRDGLDPDRMVGTSYLGDSPRYYTFTLNVNL